MRNRTQVNVLQFTADRDASRQTRDLSLASVAMGAAGTVLWSIYGIAIASGPVAIANLIIMPFAFATLVMKLRLG